MAKNRDRTEAPITLLANQVHVWHAHLYPSDSQLTHFQTLLSPDEIKRGRRFKSTQHQQDFISARGVLRLILSRYVSALPETLKFAQGPHGKPFLTNPTTPCYQFNVSHSHHHALYAVAVEREVGIDIEYHRRPLELHALIRRICSPAEQMVFSTLSPPEFERCFFACWTRKEAYLKATGKGMSIPLSSITVSLPPSECTTLIHVQGADQESLYWSMDNLFIEPDYSASLVVYGSQDYSISRFEWSWDALNP